MSTPYYQSDAVTLYHGDCIEVMRTLPDASVHAVVTDPPYGLEFMGSKWDGDEGFIASLASHAEARTRRSDEMSDEMSDESKRPFIAAGVNTYTAGVPFQQWCQLWAAECLRVLKPGGYMLAFGGSRTWHRLAVAVEDAGFEIRDSIAWLYGSGFPKSMDVSKAIDKKLGADRAPDTYTGANGLNAVYGKNMGGGVTTAKGDPVTAAAAAAAAAGWGTALKPAFEPIVVGRKPFKGTVADNFMEHGTGAINIDGCRVPTTDKWEGRELPHAALDGAAYGGVLNSSSSSSSHELGRWPTNVVLDESQAESLDAQTGILTSVLMKARTNREPRKGGTIYGADNRNIVAGDTYGDNGGASRFFPTFHYEAKAPGTERPDVDGTQHPTVKPLDLMRWLVRLVTPAGGTVLEPFAGSGTTLEAALIEGFNVIGIEREDTYLPLIMQRIRKPLQQSLFGDLA